MNYYKNNKTLLLAWRLMFVAALISLASCGTRRTSDYSYETKTGNINNACDILKDKPNWVQALDATRDKWGVDASTILTIIYQESSFKARARPKTLPGKFKPISSAYGYAQALNGTWEHYQKKTNNKNHRRDIFADAVNFMGWYIDISHKKNDIGRNSVDLIYLSYHEGWGGYAKGTYRKKPWLMKTAHDVLLRKQLFEKQLHNCRFLGANRVMNLKTLKEKAGFDSSEGNNPTYRNKGNWF